MGRKGVGLGIQGLGYDIEGACLQLHDVALCCVQGVRSTALQRAGLPGWCLRLFGGAALPLLCFPKSSISPAGKSSLGGHSAVGNGFMEAASQKLLAVLMSETQRWLQKLLVRSREGWYGGLPQLLVHPSPPLPKFPLPLLHVYSTGRYLPTLLQEGPGPVCSYGLHPLWLVRPFCHGQIQILSVLQA